MSVIVGDTPGLPPLTIPANSSCGNAQPITLSKGVDDMLILVNFAPLPGNQTFGEAGVCYVSASTNTAAVGFVNINSLLVPAMIAQGTLGDVILHEMGHAQGFGILWNKTGFWNCGPQLPSTPTTAADTYFSCPNALAQFNAVGGSSYTLGNKVPLQNTGGDGIINIHWRSSVFGNELMAPYFDAVNGTAVAKPLSKVTVGQFEDIGHVVNYAAADPYTLPAPTDAVEDDVEDGALIKMDDDVKFVDIQAVEQNSNGEAVIMRVVGAGELKI